MIIDCVGADATLTMGAAAARQMEISPWSVSLAARSRSTSSRSPYELSIQTTYWGGRPELVEVLSLGSRGLIESKTTEFSLDNAADAYEKLKAGEIEGRAVVVPG